MGWAWCLASVRGTLINYFDGRIDDVRIYNRALSAAEIAALAGGATTAPSITTQPANQTVNAGQTATFSVAATGTAPLAYQWQKNAVNISGTTAVSYTTPVTTLADSGALFRVIVSNSAGSVTSNSATLTVNAPPVINSSPTATPNPTQLK